MNRLMMVLMILGAVGASGCAAFGPACTTKSLPLYWADGRVTAMPMRVCGYDWTLAARLPEEEGSRASRKVISTASRVVRDIQRRLFPKNPR